MINKKNGNWQLCQYKVIHKSHGNEQVHYTNDRDYWQNTINKHDHLTDLRFEEMSYTAEQRQRLKELNNNDVPESYMSIAREKVRKGIPSHKVTDDKGVEPDVVTEHRVRAAIQAVEQGEMKLKDVESKYRDKVSQRQKGK